MQVQKPMASRSKTPPGPDQRGPFGPLKVALRSAGAAKRLALRPRMTVIRARYLTFQQGIRVQRSLPSILGVHNLLIFTTGRCT